MQLSDFFNLSNNKVSTGSKAAAGVTDAAQNIQINRQLKALVPGQTIHGEIISKNGSELQIRLTDELVISARLEHSMNLEMGKGMTFQVMNNGKSLILTPLFANTATDANVLKALAMSSLPVNHMTVDMTQSMMKAGLSVDKNSLQQVFREISAYLDAEINDKISSYQDKISSYHDIIDLHKMGLPVTAENLEQLASYRNMTHQLTEGMNYVTGEFPVVMEGMLQNGQVENALYLTNTILGMLEGQEGMSGQLSALQGDVLQAGNVLQEGNVLQKGYVLLEGHENGDMDIIIENKEVPKDAENAETVIHETTVDGKTTAGGIPHDARAGLLNKLQTLLDEIRLPDSDYQELQEAINQIKQNNLSRNDIGNTYHDIKNTYDLLNLTGNILQMAEKAMSGKLSVKVAGLLADPEFTRLLTDSLKSSWTLNPEDVKDASKVSELYRRLGSQLDTLAKALEATGQESSNMARGVTNLNQNLDFMNQLNQIYTYIQLPLKMNQNTAHGDLYVYTNKRNLAAKDGNVSAFLHLDMEHLGPVDIYVAMQNEKVNTHFYLSDDKMLDFLMENIHMLNERLETRGYAVKCELSVKETEASSNPVLDAILQDDTNKQLTHYAFDVRA